MAVPCSCEITMSGKSGRPAGTTSPDPLPAVLIRQELSRLRSEGVPFESAWGQALKTALASVPIEESAENRTGGTWRAALTKTKHEWRACFERTGKPLGLAALTDDDDEPELRADGEIIC
jgi:hypothetical protein